MSIGYLHDALCTRTAIEGAYLNVLINSGSINDTAKKSELLKKAESLLQKAVKIEREIVDGIIRKMKKE